MLANLSVEQSLMKAQSHAKKGELEEAQKLYEAILKNLSNNIKAQQGLDTLNYPTQNHIIQNPPQEVIDQLVALYNQGQVTTVIKQAEALTAQYPDALIVWNILGASRAQVGTLDEAIEAYKKCILLKPDYADAHNNIGVALRNQGKLNEAIEAYKKAISFKPDYAGAYSNMGVALKDQEKFDEAIEAYKKAILIKPDYAEAYDNMGVALKNKGKLDEAIEAYKKAISLNPMHFKAYYNMGNALKYQGELEEAIKFFNKALAVKPDYADAYNNMALTLLYQDKMEEAIEACKKSISLKPDYAEAHHNLGITLLRSGKLKEGLDQLEWRWKNPEFLSTKERHFLQPQWDGIENLHDKRIMIWCEQGIGDTLNWSSCLHLVASKAKHCILECQEKLVPLLKRSFPNVEIKAEDRSRDVERDDFDYHLPMGSLYKHFLDDIIKDPKPDAYLVPDPDRVNYWKERLKSLGKGPYIGIAWKSSVTSHYRSLHYPSISEWSPVLTIPEVTFINLQYKDYAEDLAKVKDELGVTVHNFEDLDQFNNIDDVAALCSALDMVTTNHGTAPLISAGVGTSTKLANWKQSPWNTIINNPRGPSVDIFERNTSEPWDNVFNLIQNEILIKNMES